ncbi:nipped-B-like protein B isoform X1 [Lates japonicus]|uniref:Nipped-B-like protein B isoform X1 n=1 Tax=Lates japonicus TaxID=270547 RepID=A0AAD3NNG8_LATJO|nr:nipped-B-like protein B isoform X1 [Lates japonicus]
MPFLGSATGASATPPQQAHRLKAGVSRLHGFYAEYVSRRSRTPTSPLSELTNLFTTSGNMLEKLQWQKV